MKHISQKLTALAAAVITAVSVSGQTASAYGVPGVQANGDLDLSLHQSTTAYGWLTQYEKNIFNHGWSTANLQDVYPSFCTRELDGISRYTATIAKNTKFGWGQGQQIFCTLASEIASINDLDRTKRYTDKFFISKRQDDGTAEPMSCVLEYDKNAKASQFAIRLLNYYDTKCLLNKYLYLEDFSFDAVTGKYSGKLVFDDGYLAGMKVSSTDIWTTFGEPKIKKEDTSILTEIPFSGRVPVPDVPVYEGVYNKIMSRAEFEEAIWCQVYAEDTRMLRAYDGHILSNLTVTYNGCSTPYVSNRFQKLPAPAKIVCSR